MNPRLRRLYDIIFNKVKNNELTTIDVDGWKIDGVNNSWEDFRDEIIGVLRKKFWDTYGNKLAEVGAVPNSIITLQDFEKYYKIEDADIANLSAPKKAQYELLRRLGYERVQPVNGACEVNTGFDVQEIRDNSILICMEKGSDEYPIDSSTPFYCIKNNKYYNGRFPLRDTYTKTIMADRIEINKEVYFLFLDEDGTVSLRDLQNNERLKGSWECVDTANSNQFYDVKFPKFTIEYRSDIKIKSK